MSELNDVVRVARKGARGHHLIDRAKYDANPKAFTLVGEDGKPVKGPKADAPEKPPKAAKAAKAPADPDLAGLRKDYKARFGKGPSPKWTSAQLREKLAAA